MQWIGCSKFVEPEFGISCAGLFVEHFPRASFLFTFPCTFFVGGKKGGSVQLSQCTDPWLNVLGHLVELLKQIAANMKVRGGVLYWAAGLYTYGKVSAVTSLVAPKIVFIGVFVPTCQAKYSLASSEVYPDAFLAFWRLWQTHLAFCSAFLTDTYKGSSYHFPEAQSLHHKTYVFRLKNNWWLVSWIKVMDFWPSNQADLAFVNLA